MRAACAGSSARLARKHPDVPIIAFPRGAATHLGRFADIEGLAAVGLDTAADPKLAAALLPGRLALQGNLDPLALIAGGAALDAAVDAALEASPPRAHIFNLGHGILPETPIAHVERMLARSQGRALSLNVRDPSTREPLSGDFSRRLDMVSVKKSGVFKIGGEIAGASARLRRDADHRHGIWGEPENRAEALRVLQPPARARRRFHRHRRFRTGPTSPKS